MLVGIERDYHPKPPPPNESIPQFNMAPRPGFHIVRVVIGFQIVDHSEHEILPGGVFLTDALGQFQITDPFLDEATCATSLGGAYFPGAKITPTPLCFEAGGPVDGTLTVTWSGGDIQLP